MCVCVCVCRGEGALAQLITERLYVNPKASVVVNLGVEANLNGFLCAAHSSQNEISRSC